MIEFDILNMHHTEMLFETFYEDWLDNMCIEMHKSIPIHYNLWVESFCVCVSISFDCTKQNEMNIHFFVRSKTCSLQNMVWMQFIISLQGLTKEFECMRDYGEKLLEIDFKLLYAIFFKDFNSENTMWNTSTEKLQKTYLLKISKQCIGQSKINQIHFFLLGGGGSSRVVWTNFFNLSVSFM